MKYLLLLLSVLLLNRPTFAGGPNFKGLCPGLTPTATVLMSKIKTLRDQLSKTAECQPISEKLSGIGTAVDSDLWKKVRNSVKTGENELTGDEVDNLSALSESVSTSLSEIVNQLVDSDSCVPPESKKSFLANFSSITSEVTKVAGAASGPYGVPVTLGGQILSGILKGIDSIFSRNKYAWDDPKEEQIYVNLFCSFINVQWDIRDYNTLNGRESELKELEKYLNVKIEDLTKADDVLGAYRKAWDGKQKTDPILKNIARDARIMEKTNLKQQFSRCTEIERAFHSPDSDLKKFIKYLEGYENSLMEEGDKHVIGVVVDSFAVLVKKYPKFAECMGMELPKRTQVSIGFNNSLRDEFFPLSDSVFVQQTEKFKKKGNKIFVKSLGSYLENSLNNRKWIKKEIPKVRKKLEDPNYSFSNGKLLEEESLLQKRFISDLFPGYLAHQVGRILENFKSYQKQFGLLALARLKPFRQTAGHKNASWKQYLEYMMKNGKETQGQRVNDVRSFTSILLNIMELRIITNIEIKTFYRYCEYAHKTLNSIGPVDATCSSGKFQIEKLITRFNIYEKDLVLSDSFLIWASTELDVLGSRINSYAVRIKTWRALGEDRWLKNTEVEKSAKITAEMTVKKTVKKSAEERVSTHNGEIIDLDNLERN